MDNNKEYLKELILNEYYDKIGNVITPDAFLAMAIRIGESKSHLIGIDYNDISSTLYGADRVDAQSGITYPRDIAEATRDIYNRLVAFHPGERVAKLLVNLDINRSGNVKMSHVTSLNDFTSELPEEVDVIWNVSFDENLTKGEVRVNVIVNFKKCRFPLILDHICRTINRNGY